MSLKSNEEIAREIVVLSSVTRHDVPDKGVSVVVEDVLIDRIASALAIAQSELARAVLSEIGKYKEPFALVRGVEGSIIDVTCNQIDGRLRDLFTRLQIETGG